MSRDFLWRCPPQTHLLQCHFSYRSNDAQCDSVHFRRAQAVMDAPPGVHNYDGLDVQTAIYISVQEICCVQHHWCQTRRERTLDATQPAGIHLELRYVCCIFFMYGAWEILELSFTLWRHAQYLHCIYVAQYSSSFVKIGLVIRNTSHLHRHWSSGQEVKANLQKRVADSNENMTVVLTLSHYI